MSLQIPKEYPLAVATCLGMSWQAWGMGVRISSFRKKIFDEEFMNSEFGALHQRQLDQAIKIGGYPDTGSGVYSRRLSYRDWYRFNVLQRIHLNYVEGMSLAQMSVLSAGLYRPNHAALLGVVYIIGRFLFSWGYRRPKGAHSRARILGVAICMLSVVANTVIFGTNLYSAMKSE